MQKAGPRWRASLGLALRTPAQPRAQVSGDPEGPGTWPTGRLLSQCCSEPPWAATYAMHDYVVAGVAEAAWSGKLPLQRPPRLSGHSMGGRGLVWRLGIQGLNSSVSAFAPISHPKPRPWGEKAFQSLLGRSHQLSAWECVCELIASAPQRLRLANRPGLRRSLSWRRSAAARRKSWKRRLQRAAGTTHWTLEAGQALAT